MLEEKLIDLGQDPNNTPDGPEKQFQIKMF